MKERPILFSGPMVRALLAEHADPDASECESCAGQGWYWQEHQVAERATDVQTFKTDCEACAGIGFIGPDAEFKRALAASHPIPERPQDMSQDTTLPALEALAHRIAWRYKKSTDPHHSDTYTFNRDTLHQFAAAIAAQAVIDRWDSPKWEWTSLGPTADLIADLRKELAAFEAAPQQEPVAWATHHEEPMLFPSREEALGYCADDEEPIALYAAPQHAGRADAQPAGKVTDEMVLAFHHAISDAPIGADDFEDIRIGIDAAMRA